jgi:hypothetical protein
MWKSKYALAFYVGVILGVFGAAQQAVQILAKSHPEYAAVAGAFLIGVALFVDILPRPNQIVQPAVQADTVQNMTVNTEPAPPADRPAIVREKSTK